MTYNVNVLDFIKSMANYSGLIVIAIMFFIVLGIAISVFPKNEKIKNAGKHLSITILLFFFCSLLAMVLYAYFEMFSRRGFSTDPEQWGQMGDFFGGMLNPILAFASFIALLYTIRIQSNQIESSKQATIDNATIPFILDIQKSIKDFNLQLYSVFERNFSTMHGSITLNKLFNEFRESCKVGLGPDNEIEDLKDLRFIACIIHGDTDGFKEVRLQFAVILHAKINSLYSYSKILNRTETMALVYNEEYQETYEGSVIDYSKMLILGGEIERKNFPNNKQKYFRDLHEAAVTEISKSYLQKSN